MLNIFNKIIPNINYNFDTAYETIKIANKLNVFDIPFDIRFDSQS